MLKFWPDDNGWGPPDIERAAKIHAQPAGRMLFEHFSGSKARAGQQFFTEAIVSETGSSIKAVNAFFGALEGANLGSFILGRKKRKTRFTWRCAPSEILNEIKQLSTGDSCALESAALSNARGEGNERETNARDATSQVDHEQRIVEHPFRLRMDLVVTIGLPASLTKAEAGRLALFVNSLPLDP
jgi:hypothetical protein